MEGGGVAVVVAAVAHLGGAGVHVRKDVVAVAAQRADRVEDDAGGGPALHVAITVVVCLVAGRHEVAVVVLAVAELRGAQEDGGVVVIAVAVGLGLAVRVEVDLAPHAGRAVLETVAVAGAHTTAVLAVVDQAVRVESDVPRALVVDEHETGGRRTADADDAGEVAVRDLWGVWVDRWSERIGGVVVAVFAAAEPDQAGVTRGVLQRRFRALGEPVPIVVEFIRGHGAVAVVVQPVAQLAGPTVDRGRAVVAVVVVVPDHAVGAALGDAVAVVVGLIWVEQAVAVVVEEVARDLDRERVGVHGRLVVVAVAAAGPVAHRGLHHALDVAVEVVVYLGVGQAVRVEIVERRDGRRAVEEGAAGELVAVVVDPVTQLGGAAEHGRVVVVALQARAGGAAIGVGVGVRQTAGEVVVCAVAVAVRDAVTDLVGPGEGGGYAVVAVHIAGEVAAAVDRAEDEARAGVSAPFDGPGRVAVGIEVGVWQVGEEAAFVVGGVAVRVDLVRAVAVFAELLGPWVDVRVGVAGALVLGRERDGRIVEAVAEVGRAKLVEFGFATTRRRAVAVAVFVEIEGAQSAAVAVVVNLVRGLADLFGLRVGVEAFEGRAVHAVLVRATDRAAPAVAVFVPADAGAVGVALQDYSPEQVGIAVGVAIVRQLVAVVIFAVEAGACAALGDPVLNH